MLINRDTIIGDNDPLIRQKSLDVPLPLSPEDEGLLRDMLEYVRESMIPEIAEAKNLQPAVGISAIQTGARKKMTAIVLRDEDGNIETEFALVNPRIVSYSLEKAYLAQGEGCLSVKEDHEGYVYRSARVKVKGYDLLRESDVLIKAEGYLAIVLQHELDHFKGTLFYDHIRKDAPFYEDKEAIRIE